MFCLSSQINKLLLCLNTKNVVSGLGIGHKYLNCRNYGLYEPDYLSVDKEKYIPKYNLMNIQIEGHDYVVLESYQKYANSISNFLGIKVEDAWALPPQHVQVKKFKPNSTVISGEYKLMKYQRYIQIKDVPGHMYSILMSILATTAPEGITFNVYEHSQENKEMRFVPDLELKQLKTQLDTIGGPSKSKK